MRPVIFDCTELYRNPVRTGIQRIVRELLRNWPPGAPRLCPVRFDASQGLLALPAQAVRLLSDEDPVALSLGHDELVRAIADGAAQAFGELPSDAILFLPEVFYDPARCAFYEDVIKAGRAEVALLVYDFLPILYPWVFRLRTAAPFMHYLHLVQNIRHVAHISERTQNEYVNRIMRGRAASPGTILPLGADGLPLEAQTWRQERRGFVALGALDGWKNQHIIVAAFLKLWEAGHDLPLTLIGRPYDGVDLTWLDEARPFRQFRWLSNASDEDIAGEMRLARATIYIPELAGFGLPPIESLYAGVPVITLSNMPSLHELATDGQLRLPRAEPDLLADAVLHLANDQAAAQAWQGAGKLKLASWRDFTTTTAGWLAQMEQTI